MTEGKSANMIGNFDATQFYRDVTNSEPLIHVLNTNEGDENVEPVTLTEDSTLGMFYKYFYLACASGRLGEATFLCADPSMNAEDFTATEILGLSTSTDAGAKGYLCFCKSRVGNLAFFKWYFVVVIINFV